MSYTPSLFETDTECLSVAKSVEKQSDKKPGEQKRVHVGIPIWSHPSGSIIYCTAMQDQIHPEASRHPTDDDKRRHPDMEHASSMYQQLPPRCRNKYFMEQHADKIGRERSQA